MKTESQKKQTLPMAVILAGGRGRRLSPLTDFLPKPLLPVGGSPLLFHILKNLEDEGVEKALILTGYKGDLIEDAVKKLRSGLEIYCLNESTPVGSAGCVKKAASLLESEFFVLCADLYGRRGYAPFYRFFKEKDAQAAMLVTKVREPGEYGVVRVSREGRVESFAEKPQWARVFSDKANAGVYLIKKQLLSLIPEGRPFDFGGQFFPSLLRAGVPVHAFDDGGVWRDVGDFSSYLSCALCENGGQSVIGKDCSVAQNAVIVDSLLFDGVRVGAGSEVRGSILDAGCTIGDNCVIPRGCVLGRNATVRPGTSLPTDTVLPPGSVAKGALETGLPDLKKLFSSSVLTPGVSASPKLLCAIGAAAAKTADGTAPIALFSDGAPESNDAENALSAGVLPLRQTALCGEATDRQAGFLTAKGGYALGIAFSASENGLRLSLFDRFGLPPSSSFLRKLRDAAAAALLSSDPEKTPSPSFSPLRREAETKSAYESALSKLLAVSPAGVSIGVGFENAPSAQTAQLLLRRGARICKPGKGDVDLTFSKDGSRLRLSDVSGALDFWHLAALILAERIRRGARRLALPYRAPRALFDLCSSLGALPLGYPLCPENDEADGVRAAAMDLPFFFDARFAAFEGLSILISSRKNVRDLLLSLPRFSVLERPFDCGEDEKLRLITSDGYRPAGEGLDRYAGRDRVAIRANDGRGLSVMIEASREEDCFSLYEKAKAELNLRKNAENAPVRK